MSDSSLSASASLSRMARDFGARRHSHRGGVLWFTGLSGSGKSTLAIGLENILFIPTKHQRLMVENDILHDDSIILDDAMQDRFVIHMLLDIHGGCRYKKSTSMFRWKWKKKRTKRLQRKRRKMRMRAR